CQALAGIIVGFLQRRAAVPGMAAAGLFVGGEDVGGARSEGGRGGDGGGEGTSEGKRGESRAHGISRYGRRQVVGRTYGRNMRRAHGWVAGLLAGLILSTASMASPPHRIVSTFLC